MRNIINQQWTFRIIKRKNLKTALNIDNREGKSLHKKKRGKYPLKYSNKDTANNSLVHYSTCVC